MPVVIQGCMRMPALPAEEAAEVIRTACDHCISYLAAGKYLL